MIKNFPKSRICVIDILPAIEQGLQKALEFLNKYNMSTQTVDGKKILLSFCIKEAEMTYKNTKSLYPKVTCISTDFKSKRTEHFIANLLSKVILKMSFPHCGTYSMCSPELEAAAEASLSKPKTTKSSKKLKISLKIKS